MLVQAEKPRGKGRLVHNQGTALRSTQGASD